MIRLDQKDCIRYHLAARLKLKEYVKVNRTKDKGA